MEEQCSPLSWAYYYQEEGVEELKYSLLYSTLELEAAVLSAHEEISRKDDEILRLKGSLAKIIKEKDEFQAKCQDLVQEKHLLLQQVQVHSHSSKQHLECPISSNNTSNLDDNSDRSPSDCDDNNNIVVASPACKDTATPPAVTPPQEPILDVMDKISIKKPLPEKGKFLKAIMEAGPLLQTLLLAGPLPQWQHPPPQLHSKDIPPVSISSPSTKILHQDSSLISPRPAGGGLTNNRAMENLEGLDFSPKYQKVCSPIIIDPNISRLSPTTPLD